MVRRHVRVIKACRSPDGCNRAILFSVHDSTTWDLEARTRWRWGCEEVCLARDSVIKDKNDRDSYRLVL